MNGELECYAPAGHWGVRDEDGNFPAITPEEWAELMAEVTAEQERLEAEVSAEKAERSQLQADLELEQTAFHACRVYERLQGAYNSHPIVVKEKPRGGLRVVAKARSTEVYGEA